MTILITYYNRYIKPLPPEYKSTIVIWLIFVIIMVVFWIEGNRSRKIMRKDGVYVIAVVTGSSQGKSGPTVRGIYSFKGRTYNLIYGGSVGVAPEEGQWFFIKILPYDPESFQIQRDKRIPNCLRDSVNLTKYWRTLPNCY